MFKGGEISGETETQYKFLDGIFLQIGDGTTSTTFKDKKVDVTLGEELDLEANTFFQLGEIANETIKTTKEGCVLRCPETGGNLIVTIGYTDITLNLFGTIISGRSGAEFYYGYAQGKFWNCIFQDFNTLEGEATEIDFFNVLMENTGAFEISYINNDSFDKFEYVSTRAPNYGVWIETYSAPMTLRNFYLRDYKKLRMRLQNLADLYAIDWDLDEWKFQWDFGKFGEFYRQYSFDLTMFFENGTQFQNANVTISNDYLDSSSSWLTFANGSIPQQTYSMGHYNITGGNTIYDYNPYNLTVTYDGYETYSTLINITQKENLKITINMETPSKTTGWTLAFFVIGILIIAPLIALIVVKKL